MVRFGEDFRAIPAENRLGEELDVDRGFVGRNARADEFVAREPEGVAQPHAPTWLACFNFSAL